MSDTLTVTVCACTKHVLDPPSQTITSSNEDHTYGECVVTTTTVIARSSSPVLKDFPNASEIPCSVCGVTVLYHYKGAMTPQRLDEIATTLICSAKCAPSIH